MFAIKTQLEPAICLHVRLYLHNHSCVMVQPGEPLCSTFGSVWVMEQGESLWLLNRASRIIMRRAERLFLGRGRLWALLGLACPLGPLPGLMEAACKVARGAVLWGQLQRYTCLGTTTACFGLNVGGNNDIVNNVYNFQTNLRNCVVDAQTTTSSLVN